MSGFARIYFYSKESRSYIKSLEFRYLLGSNVLRVCLPSSIDRKTVKLPDNRNIIASFYRNRVEEVK